MIESSLLRVLVVLTVAVYGCLAPERAEETPPLGTLELLTETIELADGGAASFDRGMLVVPLRRDQSDSRRLEVEVHRFPAVTGVPPETPPLFLLNGGPGWPGFGDSLHKPGFWEREIRPFTEIGDLVFIGQRGIGSSTGTPCDPPHRLSAAATQEEQAEAIREASRRCRKRWEEEGFDLTGFNVIEAAADVADAARALGYDKISLSGVSFGSHWSMAVMRYHPDVVARALLGGMEGPDHTYDMPSWVLNALHRIAAEADQDPRLAPHIPEGGLMAAFEDVLRRVGEEEILVEVDDPVSGKRQRVRVESFQVRELASGYTNRVTSRRGMPSWPGDILRLHRGEFQQLADRLASSNPGSLPPASFFMLDCGSGISPQRADELRRDPAAAVVGPLGRFYDTACPEWGSDLGEEFRRNFETDIPTVIVHGNWDISTPLENALELLPYFTNSRFVLVKGGSHGALQEAVSASESFREAAKAFLMNGDMSGLPEEVELPPIEWAVPE